MSVDINVCIACDDNYSKYAGVVIASILLNAGEEDEFCFYILDDGISDRVKLRIDRLKSIRYFEIHYIPVDKSTFEIYKNIPTKKDIPLSSYYRLGISRLLPQKVDRVIYLDCDIIVTESLRELFYTNLNDGYIAGVPDTKTKFQINQSIDYINPGVLLMNLDQIRRDDVENKFIQYAQDNQNNIKNGVSDIINYALPDDKIEIIDEQWNVQVSNFLIRSSYTNNPYIIHYTGNQKPWIFASYNHFKKEYFNILNKTPWEIPYDEKFKWGIWNGICAFIHFTFGKSLFFFRLKFWDKILRPAPEEEDDDDDK